MIEVDQKALYETMRKFSASVAYKAQFLSVATSRVLKVESNRLAQTLMHYTPPLEKAGAEQKIERELRLKAATISLAGDADYDDPGSIANRYAPIGDAKHGKGGVYWYLWTSSLLHGIAKDSEDFRGASWDVLRKVFQRNQLNSAGMVKSGTRGNQAVRVWKTILFKKSTLKELIRHQKQNVGRLKAGWLIGWRKTGAGIGIYRPPQWVLRHESTKYSDADVTKLESKDAPEVTLTNRAHAVNTPGMRRIAHAALTTRINAIPNRLAQILKHPELLEKEVTA